MCTGSIARTAEDLVLLPSTFAWQTPGISEEVLTRPDRRCLQWLLFQKPRVQALAPEPLQGYATVCI